MPILTSAEVNYLKFIVGPAANEGNLSECLLHTLPNPRHVTFPSRIRWQIPEMIIGIRKKKDGVKYNTLNKSENAVI